jgi:hypothetical protein
VIDKRLIRAVQQYQIQEQNQISETTGRYNIISKLVGRIPEDPSLFYKDFGLLEHPLTGKPVTDLTDYQKEAWNDVNRYRYLLNVKSNKIGLSTLHLLSLFYHMITDCMGYQALVIGQNLRMSREHLYTLHKLILNSEKYRPFLISIGDKDMNLLREETSRVTEMFLRNPMNPHKPTRIIAIPANAGSAVSWKEVKYIMCSDITMTEKNYDATIKGLFTRLANTQGYFVIETIPNGPVGLVYDTMLRNRAQQSTDFKVREYPVAVAVKAGLISEEFLKGERQRHGIDFDRLYNCSFEITSGNVFSMASIENATKIEYDPDLVLRNCPISIGVDPGIGGFGICVSREANGRIEIIIAEQYSRPSFSDMVKKIWDITRKHSDNFLIYVDANNPEIWEELKRQYHEADDNKIVTDQLAHCKKYNIDPSTRMKVIPYSFSHNQGAHMLQHTKSLIESPDNLVAIHPRFRELLTALKTAALKGYDLDKKITQYNDVLDGLRLSLNRYSWED